jgi:hypothetical protein
MQSHVTAHLRGLIVKLAARKRNLAKLLPQLECLRGLPKSLDFDS